MKTLNCLQCGNEATETSEVTHGVKIRVCGEGHRTGVSTPKMLAYSKKLKRINAKARKGVIDFVPSESAVESVPSINGMEEAI